jgi:hypothetical protein
LTFVLHFDKSMTWSEANEFCESQGGHLVTINSEGEQRFIENLIARGSKNFYWLGGDAGQNRQFRWVTGEPMNYKN